MLSTDSVAPLSLCPLSELSFQAAQFPKRLLLRRAVACRLVLQGNSPVLLSSPRRNSFVLGYSLYDLVLEEVHAVGALVQVPLGQQLLVVQVGPVLVLLYQVPLELCVLDLTVDLVVGQLLQRRHDLHVQELALGGLRALVHQVLALRLQKYQLLVHKYLVLDVVLCPLDEVPGEQLVGRLERVFLRVLPKRGEVEVALLCHWRFVEAFHGLEPVQHALVLVVHQ